MGNYTLIISKDAQKEISCFYQLGDKAIIKKLSNCEEIWQGVGQDASTRSIV